ncbi:unnamed protein product [Rhizophagus irregularis]|nr:unnamed protein product [Rhizophagus irregularis]
MGGYGMIYDDRNVILDHPYNIDPLKTSCHPYNIIIIIRKWKHTESVRVIESIHSEFRDRNCWIPSQLEWVQKNRRHSLNFGFKLYNHGKYLINLSHFTNKICKICLNHQFKPLD